MINLISNSSSLARAPQGRGDARGLVDSQPASSVSQVSQVSQVERVSAEHFSQQKDNSSVFPKVIKVENNSVQSPLVDRRRSFVQQQPGFQRPETRYQVNQQMIQREELDRLVGIDIRV